MGELLKSRDESPVGRLQAMSRLLCSDLSPLPGAQDSETNV